MTWAIISRPEDWVCETFLSESVIYEALQRGTSQKLLLHLSLSGNNGTLYGSGGDVSLSLLGSNNNSVIDFSFQAGGNTVSASGNNDVLYGAIRDLSINLIGGSGNSADFSGTSDLDNYVITLGSKAINVGNRNNDVVYGAMRNYSMTLGGGNGINEVSVRLN